MSKTILIVEDNELNMKLFNDLLQAHGYNTLQVKDGRSVVEITRLNRPDLILISSCRKSPGSKLPRCSRPTTTCAPSRWWR
jgi:DNA-binding response OmpR family regulator